MSVAAPRERRRSRRAPPDPHAFLDVPGSDAAARIAAGDWQRPGVHASLGVPGEWPPVLRAHLGAMLRSAVPCLLEWGHDGPAFCNDALLSLAGAERIGSPDAGGGLVWPALWQASAQVRSRVRDRRQGVIEEQVALETQAGGPSRLSWLTLNCAPVLDENAALAGLMITLRQAAGTRSALPSRDPVLALLDRLRDHSAAAGIAAATAELLGRELHATRCLYLEVDRAGLVARAIGQWHEPRLAPLADPRLRLQALAGVGKADPAASELRAGRSIRHTGRHGSADPAGLFGGAASLAIPLVRHDRLAAIVVLCADAPRDWTEAEQDLACTCGERAREAIERASLQATLRQAERMETIGQFAGGLAHDLNNLVTGVMGSLELLELRIEQGRVADARRCIAAAQDSAGRVATLTQQLLAYSRRQSLDPRPVPLAPLLASLAPRIAERLGPGIALSLPPQDLSGPILCDPAQLEAAILHLCANARDAMPKGGTLALATAELRLEGPDATSLDVADGPYATLAVSDDGEGMSPATAIRAFDPFFSTRPIGHGTGLGLSMVQGFARQSGGQATIHSEPGAGTTVTLFLPLLADPGLHDPAAAGDEPGARIPARRTVLVVEDEPILRMLMAEMLEEHGIEAFEAGDAAAALDLLRTDTRIDLLVTDLGLPREIDGVELAEAARALRPGLLVLFVTGHVGLERRDAAAGTGTGRWTVEGGALMTKPFTMEALAVKVRSILGLEQLPIG